MHCLETLSAPQLPQYQHQTAEARSVSEWRLPKEQVADREHGLSERQAAAMRIWLSILTIVVLVLMSSDVVSIFPR